MYIVLVHLHVVPAHREAFLEAMVENASRSLGDEPGCLRFDVIEDETDPNHLFLYEIYRDRAAFDVHLQTPHFRSWRDAVKDWHAAPLRSFKGENLFPAGDAVAAGAVAAGAVAAGAVAGEVAAGGAGSPTGEAGG